MIPCPVFTFQAITPSGLLCIAIYIYSTLNFLLFNSWARYALNSDSYKFYVCFGCKWKLCEFGRYNQTKPNKMSQGHHIISPMISKHIRESKLKRCIRHKFMFLFDYIFIFGKHFSMSSWKRQQIHENKLGLNWAKLRTS